MNSHKKKTLYSLIWIDLNHFFFSWIISIREVIVKFLCSLITMKWNRMWESSSAIFYLRNSTRCHAYRGQFTNYILIFALFHCRKWFCRVMRIIFSFHFCIYNSQIHIHYCLWWREKNAELVNVITEKSSTFAQSA